MPAPSLRTSSLRRQHDAAIALAGKILELIERMGDAPDRGDAFETVMTLSKMTGLLRIHFAQEDQLLYPSLMASGRGGVAATARTFFAEMGQIGPLFAAYSERWRSTESLMADPAGFRTETRPLFGALADRITRENEILYPLADELDGAGAERAA